MVASHVVTLLIGSETEQGVKPRHRDHSLELESMREPNHCMSRTVIRCLITHESTVQNPEQSFYPVVLPQHADRVQAVVWRRDVAASGRINVHLFSSPRHTSGSKMQHAAHQQREVLLNEAHRSPLQQQALQASLVQTQQTAPTPRKACSGVRQIQLAHNE